MADHPLVLERQAASLVAGSLPRLQERLRVLESAEYLRRVRVFDEFCCLIRRRGLAAVGSSLPVPRLSLPSYSHAVGTAWLWLAAHDGAFGPVAEVLAERRLRSHDEAAVSPDRPYAVRLGGYDSRGGERRHYPDLVLVDHQGRRLALELELSPKGLRRHESILAGYGADRSLDGVIYLVEANSAGRAIARSIESSAGRMRLHERVNVRFVAPIELGGGGTEPSRGSLGRARSRAPAAPSAMRSARPAEARGHER